MDNNSFNPSSIRGFLCTILLYIFAKVTVSNVASFATIASGCTVVIVNIPKILLVYNNYLRPKRKRK
jgi:hypothetical protein